MADRCWTEVWRSSLQPLCVLLILSSSPLIWSAAGSVEPQPEDLSLVVTQLIKSAQGLIYGGGDHRINRGGNNEYEILDQYNICN